MKIIIICEEKDEEAHLIFILPKKKVLEADHWQGPIRNDLHSLRQCCCKWSGIRPISWFVVIRGSVTVVPLLSFCCQYYKYRWGFLAQQDATFSFPWLEIINCFQSLDAGLALTAACIMIRFFLYRLTCSSEHLCQDRKEESFWSLPSVDDRDLILLKRR